MLRMACLAALALALSWLPARGEAQVGGSGSDAEARSLFEAGEVAFREGRFENALEYLQRSYELSHRPALLYNLGTTYDRLRRDAEALAAFERYLEEVPDAAQRAQIERRIAVLRESIARGAPSPDAEDETGAPEGGDPAPASETSDGAALPGWTTLGVGAAVLVGGGILLGVALADVAAVENAADGTSWSAVSAAHGRSEGESIAGIVLLSVGAAASATGLVWALTSGDTTRAEIAPTAGGLLLRGTF